MPSEQKMAKQKLFQEWLNREIPILADGAMGTMLHAQGLSMETCFDEYNLTQPALIADIHREYINAGAELIETNTFAANRFKLVAHGLEDSVPEINAAAVLLARRVIEASFKDVLLAGSVGPLGVHIAPFGRVQPEQAYQVFHEQIAALVEAGVDLILIETHNDLEEIHQAIRAAKDISDIPVITTLTFTRDDRTLLGENPTRAAKRMVEFGADMIGANCSSGPAQLLRILRQMRMAEPEARFCVMPNAGWPERVSGRIMYPATADYFGEYAQAFCEAGASIIGGCCGTTPEHIASMRSAIDCIEAPCIESPASIRAAGALETAAAAREPTGLAMKLEANRFVISVEMDPPRGFATHKLLAGASLLAEAGADVINVADSPMARMRMSPWAVCNLIQREVGIDSVLHFPTRGRNLLRVQGDLLAAHALDVRNIFVVLGDPTSIGDYPDAMDDYDLVPSGLIKLIKQELNAGVDHTGADIGDATSFFVGCALNLCAKDPEREMRVLRKKIDNGADFALTQPVYEPHLASQFIESYEERYGPLSISVLVGVLPLYGTRHAAFLHNEVPGIQIPEPIRNQIDAAGDGAPQEGVRISIELLNELSSIVQGVYLMPPFHRYDLAADIIEAIRQSE
jgi:homocysteine S-methyltransferase